ncbi:phosphotransferase [Tenacibaculum xiamenense]|uniref:phosphotransferase n=1 Tax=Tenacibaculum xiamenense TaxID=1261553 RepID=UPI003894CFBE
MELVMEDCQVKEIFDVFDCKGDFEQAIRLESGHINNTYLIHTNGEDDYVLQKINHLVFKDIPGLINNKVTISNHIRNELSHLPTEQIKRKVLTLVKVKNSEEFYYEEDGSYWNLMVYIKCSFTYEVVRNKEIAYEGGKLMGNFLNLTNDFDASTLTTTIPKFHDMSFRFSNYKYAIQSSKIERLRKASVHTDVIICRLKEEMHILQNLKELGEIPLRVTHNDPKISNILFDELNKGLCIIDTDTVMSGIVHYDFGDAIRTICNTAKEDETDLSKVEFNLEYYKAYTKGFLSQMGDSLTPTEKKYLPLAAKTMIFIMGLRFLTDYLMNDVYYKTKYPEHNLDRARNQFKLIESLEKQFDKMSVQ